MDIKSTVAVTVELDGHQFTLNMPVGASWGTAINAAYKLFEGVTEMAKSSQPPIQPEQQPVKSDS